MCTASSASSTMMVSHAQTFKTKAKEKKERKEHCAQGALKNERQFDAQRVELLTLDNELLLCLARYSFTCVQHTHTQTQMQFIYQKAGSALGKAPRSSKKRNTIFFLYAR